MAIRFLLDWICLNKELFIAKYLAVLFVVYRRGFRMYCPRALWSYGVTYVSKIMQITASFAAYLQGRTPFEALTGETPDISQYLEFGFYESIMVQRRCRTWRDQNSKIPRSIPSHRISHELLGFASKWNTDVQNNRTTSHKFGITNRTMQETI